MCEHTGVGGRSVVTSPSLLLASQSGEILGVARETAQAKAGCSQNACGVEDVLQLLRILYIIGGDSASNTRTMQEGRKRPGLRGREAPFVLQRLLCFQISTRCSSTRLQRSSPARRSPPRSCSRSRSASRRLLAAACGPGFDACLCLQEPLALASGALPDWCEQLTAKCPFLIPFETRQLYFTCTAFGASRFISLYFFGPVFKPLV